jgi:outer membrane biosynthesis protein TonB
MNTTATTYIRYSEPTVRSNVSQAYSQCLPEPDYGYSQQPNASYYNAYAPMPQQPMQAPVAKSSSSGKGLLWVAGLAVVGAAAFGGVMLLNSNDAQSTQTASTTTPATDTTESTIVNLPSAVDIPALAPAQNAPAPVIVNNSTPVRVNGPAFAPKPVTVPTPKPAVAPGPPPAPAPAPAPAPKPGPGVSVEAPGVEVGVPSQGGVSVKTSGVEVGVPGQNGGDVVVAVPGPQTGGGTTTPSTGGGTTTPSTGGGTTTPSTGGEGSKPAGGAGTTAEGPTQAGNATTDEAANEALNKQVQDQLKQANDVFDNLPFG